MILILGAGGLALLVSLYGTPLLIKLLRRQGYAQAIRTSTSDVTYPEHEGKKGTPSMGGLVIIAAVHLGYFGSHLITWNPVSVSGLLLLFLITGLGLVGFIDDYIKVFQQRSTGLRARTKLIGQAIVALVFGVLALQFPDERGQLPAGDRLSLVRDFGPSLRLTGLGVLASIIVVLWIYFMITATSNGVNLADGLDGLAAGACIFTFGAYVLICLFQFDPLVGNRVTYAVRDPLDLAICAAALLGACIGFLWWNASPARIFMGDTGSLALGGAVAGLAILSRTQLLLLLLGGIFVIISASVILQVGSFKLTGKRIFRMAPLQHHFEMMGWAEITIVIRMWIIAALLVSMGVGLFYAEWLVVRPD